jgi:magnesium transporter
VKVERLLVSGFLADHPADAARLLEAMPFDQAVAVMNEASVKGAARALSSLSADLAARCLENLPPAKASELLNALPPASAAAFLRRVDKGKRQPLLDGVPAKSRERLQSLLRYSEESAGAVMDSLTVTIPDDITVEQAGQRLRETPEHLCYYVYVVNREQRLAGVVGLRELLMANGHELVRTVMSPKVMTLSDRDPLVAVVAHPGWREFHAMPVVSDDGVFAGMIRYRTLRRLAEAYEQAGRAGAGFDTLFALGELYWTGLVELFGGMSSGSRSRL